LKIFPIANTAIMDAIMRTNTIKIIFFISYLPPLKY
jgi:hypothetical protein